MVNVTEKPLLGYVDGKFNGNYWQWLKMEFKNVFASKFTLTVWFFSLGFQLANLLANPINWQSIVTFIASAVGVLCCCAMALGAPLNGLLGLVSAFGFIAVNFATAHWWSVIDQLIFMAVIDIPLIFKWKTWGANIKEKTRSLGKKGWIATIIGLLIAWGALYFVGTLIHDSAVITDSLVLAIGATASLLVTLKINNCYLLWLLEDVANVLLWISTATHLGISGSTVGMLVTTLIYFATALYGQFISPVWTSGKDRKTA